MSFGSRHHLMRLAAFTAIATAFPLAVFGAEPTTNPSSLSRVWGVSSGKTNLVILGDGHTRATGFGKFTALQYDLASGTLQAKDILATASNDRALAVVSDKNGGTYVAGIGCDPVTGKISLRTIKYNEVMTRQWMRAEILYGLTCRGAATLDQSRVSLALSPNMSAVYVASTIGESGPLRVYKYNTQNGTTPKTGRWPIIDAKLKLAVSTLEVDPTGIFLIVSGTSELKALSAGAAGGKLVAAKFSANDGSPQPNSPLTQSWKGNADNIIIRQVSVPPAGLTALGSWLDSAEACHITLYGSGESVKGRWSVVTPSNYLCRDVLSDKNYFYTIGYRRDSASSVVVVRQYDAAGNYLREVPLKPSPAAASLEKK